MADSTADAASEASADASLATLSDDDQIELLVNTAPGAEGTDVSGDSGPKSDHDAEITASLPQEPGSLLDG